MARINTVARAETFRDRVSSDPGPFGGRQADGFLFAVFADLNAGQGLWSGANQRAQLA